MADADQRVYWAAEPDSKKCVERFLKEARSRYLQMMKKSGRYERTIRSYNTYHGNAPDGLGDTSQTATAGKKNEYVDVTTNDFAQLVQQGHILITQSPPVFKGVAANTDTKSREGAELSDILNEYYENVGEMVAAENSAARGMLKSAESWVVIGWDRRRGKPVSADLENNQEVREGDTFFLHKAPWDVCYDLEAGAQEASRWLGFRDPSNRFELAANHPQCAPELLAGKQDGPGEADEFPWRKSNVGLSGGDYVWVWEIRHLATSAVPNGRLIRFVNSDIILFDSIKAPGSAYEHLSLYGQDKPNTYAANTDPTKQAGLADFGYPYGDTLMAVPFAAERVEGDLEPHTSYFDLLSLQEGIDTAMSAAASAANTGGATNWQTGPAPNLAVHDLAGGFKVIETSSEIKKLEGATVDEGVIRFGEACLEFMRRRVGFNNAALGDVTKGMPAQAMALLRAEAIQYHSHLQQVFYLGQAKVRTANIKLLAKFATTQRVASIAGKSRTYQLKTFAAVDLEGFDRFTFTPLSPAMRTQAGREAYADKLLGANHINARQYITLVTTGRADAMWETEAATLDSIQREKEILREGRGLPPVQMLTGPDGQPSLGPDGKPLPLVDENGEPKLGAGDPGKDYIRPLAYDPHWLYIPEDRSVIAMPDSRTNPAVVTAVLDVIGYRNKLMMQMPSSIAMLLEAPSWLVDQLKMQEMPPMMPPGPGGPPPGRGGPGSPPPPPPPNGGPAGQVAHPPGAPPIHDVKQPKPPRNPLTGEQPPAPGAQP